MKFGEVRVPLKFGEVRVPFKFGEVRSSSSLKSLFATQDSPYWEEPVKILMPANSFLLFDSNLLHMNVASSADCSGWNRRAAYLCMQPRAWRTPEVYLEKVRAYIRGQGTSHWACFCDVKKKPQWPRSSHGLRPLSPVNVLFECDGSHLFHTMDCIPRDRRDLL